LDEKSEGAGDDTAPVFGKDEEDFTGALLEKE
jgi:hypothetical protein